MSDVVPTPGGPVIVVDAGGLPGRALGGLLDALASRLEREGLDDAVVTAPPTGGPLDTVGELPNCVALHVWPVPDYRPRARAVVPEWWGPEALAWLGTKDPARGTWAEPVVGMQFEVDLAEASALLDGARRSRSNVRFAVGEPPGRIALALVQHRPASVTLGVAGEELTETEMLSVLETLTDIGRHLAPEAGYAFIELRDRAIALAIGPGGAGRMPGCASWDGVLSTCDRLVLDGYHWQVIGEGHVERLGGLPPGARPLGNGRFEVVVGSSSDWRPNSAEGAAVQAHSRAMFAPCLVTPDEEFTLNLVLQAEAAQWSS